MNLVVGATGFLGFSICRRLVKAHRPVRALVRKTADPAKIEALKTLGVSLVYGDLKDRRSLDLACVGVDTVITTATTTISRQPDDSISVTDQKGQLNLIDAARAVGVRRFIYISYTGHIRTDCPLTTAKRTVEQYLRDSGLVYTILRPTYFMEMWLSPMLGFDYLQGTARIYGMGQAKISWISREDVAAFAVESLDNPAARNVVLELGGPEALSPLEVVKIFEAKSGKPFRIEHVSEDALKQQKAEALDPLQQSFTALMLDYAHGGTIDMRGVTEKFRVPLTSVRDYAAEMLTGEMA